jgi:hypothetical protein
MSIFAFGPNLWVVDVSDILVFRIEEDKYWPGGSLFSRPRNKCYLCIGWCLFGTNLKLNLMISHRLADDYVMTYLFSFGYDLLKSFCSVCKSFLLANFMNENEVFPFKKRWSSWIMWISFNLISSQ